MYAYASYRRSGIKTKYEKKYFFGDFLSADFWQKPALKKFLKNLQLGVDVGLQVPPLTQEINAHNMSGARSYSVNLTEGL